MKSKICVFVVALFTIAGAGWAKSEPVTDDAVYNNVKIKLASDAVVKGGALQIDVKDGVVTLGGPVEQEKQKDRAEKLARKVRGVRQVVNNITIRSRTPEK
jgi:osmotically-inducible protein OsmY